MSQLWKVHSVGSYIMVESYETELCTSADFEFGDAPVILSEACGDAIVSLRGSRADFGVQWYFTG